MNLDTLRPVRKIITAGAVALVAAACFSAATPTTSAGHPAGQHSKVAQATKEWKTGGPTGSNVSSATKEWKTGGSTTSNVISATKEWKTGGGTVAPSTKEW
jgi:methylthioribose-1-phosphate isomerase